MSIWAVLFGQLVIFGVIAVIAYARGSRHSLDLAPPPPNAQWAPDPTGRHQLRMFDGRQWTANVSDGGISGWDPLQ